VHTFHSVDTDAGTCAPQHSAPIYVETSLIQKACARSLDSIISPAYAVLGPGRSHYNGACSQPSPLSSSTKTAPTHIQRHVHNLKIFLLCKWLCFQLSCAITPVDPAKVLFDAQTERSSSFATTKGQLTCVNMSHAVYTDWHPTICGI
jgi:hypothetical protein